MLMCSNIYIRERDQLVVFTESTYSISHLYDTFIQNPFETVYIVDDFSQTLKGIVTLGDLLRMGDSLYFNKTFTKILVGNEQQARQMMSEKPSINMLPVVDASGILLYDYCREPTECVINIPKSIIFNMIAELLAFSKEELIYISSEYYCQEINQAIQVLNECKTHTIRFVNKMTLNEMTALPKSVSVKIYDFNMCSERFAERLSKEFPNIMYVACNIPCDMQLLETLMNIYSKIGVVCNKDRSGFWAEVGIEKELHIIDFHQLKYDNGDFYYNDEALPDLEIILTLKKHITKPYIYVNNKKVIIADICSNDSGINDAYDYDIALNIIPKLKENGINFIVIDNPDNFKDSFDLSSNIPYLSMDVQALREFLRVEASDDELVNTVKGITVVKKNGFLCWADIHAKNYTFTNGERYIPENDSDYENQIYMFGPCLMMGNFADDYHTVGYFMRKKLPMKYRVKCCGNAWEYCSYAVRSQQYKENDILLFLANDGAIYKEEKIEVQNLFHAYKRIPDLKHQVDDSLLHTNCVANRYIADEILSFIQPIISAEKTKVLNDNRVCFGRQHKITLQQTIDKELEQYIQSLTQFKVSGKRKIGAIVMNCNPFTLGHRYLIEEAKKVVDYLYIFVLQEDKSFFKFSDRFRMVQMGTKDLKDVCVIPSGKYIISTHTLPGYFDKENKPFVMQDSVNDLSIFCRYIAPALNITYRFAGEEPIDVFTRQYNLSMRDILPQYHLKFVEIPRKTVPENPGTQYISASLVREMLKTGQYGQMKKMLLPDVYDYIIQRYADAEVKTDDNEE